MPTSQHCQSLYSRRNQSEHHCSSRRPISFAFSSQSSQFRAPLAPDASTDRWRSLFKTQVSKTQYHWCMHCPKESFLSFCKPSLCASCLSARARQRNTEVWTTITHQESLFKLKDLEHGFRMSINMYKSAVQERLATTRWSEGFGPIPATLPVAT